MCSTLQWTINTNTGKSGGAPYIKFYNSWVVTSGYSTGKRTYVRVLDSVIFGINPKWWPWPDSIVSSTCYDTPLYLKFLFETWLQTWLWSLCVLYAGGFAGPFPRVFPSRSPRSPSWTCGSQDGISAWPWQCRCCFPKFSPVQQIVPLFARFSAINPISMSKSRFTE